MPEQQARQDISASIARSLSGADNGTSHMDKIAYGEEAYSPDFQDNAAKAKQDARIAVVDSNEERAYR